MGADRPNGGDLYKGGGSLYRNGGDMLSQGGGRPERRRKGNRRFNTGQRPGLKNKFDSNPFSQYNGNIYERDQLYSPSNMYSVEESLGAVQKQTNNKDPSGIGIGVFQDVGLVSESGFRPILPSDNNSPTLAFSIYDNPEKDALIDTAMDRMDSFQGHETEVGDRGNIVVNIPTSVLPYTPNLSDQDQLNDSFYPEDYADDYDYDEMDGDYSEINPVYSLDNSVPNLRFSRDSSPEDAGTLSGAILAGNSGDNKMAESKMQLTHFKSETADLPYIPKTGVQRSLMVDAPINSIYQILDKTTDGKMDVSDIKEDDYENNSADFHSFETVYNPAAEIKVGNVQDVLVKTSDLEAGKPVLLNVASSFSYGDNKTPQIAPHAVGSVSAPQYLLESSENGGNSTPGRGQDVVYGKGVDQPPGPLSLLEKVDERIVEKLDLLHQTSGDTNLADVVKDFWTGR